MRQGQKLTLMAAALAAALSLAPPANALTLADERPSERAKDDAVPNEQKTPPPSGGCPYRGGKLELIA